MLHEQSAGELAAMIRNKQVSSRDVVEAHLARIAAVNDDVNAVTVVLAESARAAADKADRTPPYGPLHGVPFSIKENIDGVGSATTHGVRRLAGSVPYLDAPSVEKLKAAGAIPIARTNMSEMGLRLCCDNPLRGRTRNPVNRALTAGGSSGGDAAAVSTGMVPFGLGNDMGGSLRLPAHFCHVAALKPTAGRVAYASSLEPQDQGFAVQFMAAVGPIAKKVEDLELCLKVLAGRHVRDPRSVDAPLEGASQELRAAIVTSMPGMSREARDSVERAGRALEKAGWIVEEDLPPEIERAGEVWHKLVATDFSVVMPLMAPMLSEPLVRHMKRFCDAAKLHESLNQRIHSERSRLMRAWSGFFTEYAVVVGPNVSVPLWAPDADLDEKTGLELIRAGTQFILPGNALGLPCVALPMGVVDGRPTSVQVYADLWREDLCLSAARAIERHT